MRAASRASCLQAVSSALFLWTRNDVCIQFVRFFVHRLDTLFALRLHQCQGLVFNQIPRRHELVVTSGDIGLPYCVPVIAKASVPNV